MIGFLFDGGGGDEDDDVGDSAEVPRLTLHMSFRSIILLLPNYIASPLKLSGGGGSGGFGSCNNICLNSGGKVNLVRFETIKWLIK